MQKRDLKMDIFKGLLVVGMVYCHILQFFVDLGKDKVADHITWYINVITFSGFVFTFGYTSYIAYFSKHFKDVYKKILMAFFKLLIAFYISGISFRVLSSHWLLNKNIVKNVILLKDIPGWSEFIISFALYILIAAILFKPLKMLVEKKWLFWIIVPLLLLTTLMPYERVTSNQLGLFIGTYRFASFPILQYMPWFLLGMYFKRYEIGINRWVIAGSAVLSGIGLTYMGLNKWQLPGRFPPTVFWVILPAFGLCIYYIIGYLIDKYQVKCGVLLIMGQNTMVYLLLSNIIIFAVSGSKMLRPINGFKGFVGNIILLSIITYLIQMARPLPKGKRVTL